MKVEPRDHSARRRFAEELDRNFSVVASAGSGKTHAITERIAELARASNAIETLPKLVVVTFTHRAADEMQQRTRQKILAERPSPAVQAAFNRAFFGTIHSFCMKLLTNYGHYLGLPSPLDLVAEDDEELWEAFVQQHQQIGRTLDSPTRETLFRLAPARHLMELGRNSRTILSNKGTIGPCPKIDLTELYAARDTGARENISKSQAELVQWEKRLEQGWEFLRWPICFTSQNSKFTTLWRSVFSPLSKWIADAASCVAAEVQRDFRDFRIERGLVTYPDQVALADELLRHPVAAQRLRGENFRVILDEAQDTDPVQFSVLTEITRPADAGGRWLEVESAPPRPGHFCMVGDFQQSIYRDRADLNMYKAIHQALLRDGSADELEFSVTFRLDQEQLNFVNEIFRGILNDKDGQVRFVELQPRPQVLPGQVIRIPLGADLLPKGEKVKDYQKARIEANELAKWIKATGHERLRADSWSEVAILCPRKLWLRTMATALRRVGLPVTIQSESDLRGDNPAYAWLTALCTIMVDPRNAYETVGVLREVFGLPDHDLAIFSEGVGERFHLDPESSRAGIVSSPLKLLAETRQQIFERPLFEAIKLLVEKTQLRQKLESLPPEDFPDLGSELDTLLTLAGEEEARGATLADFAEKLRLDFLLQREVRRSTSHGLQLITAQKAKGSEWQAVILPFLGRNVMAPSPRYPCLIKVPGKTDSLVALTKDDFPEENREATKKAVQQEMARLLYVATTRARHTLVLALDEEIFARSNGEMQSGAQLRTLLGDQQANRPHFEQLSDTPAICPRTAQERHAATTDSDASTTPLPSLARTERKRARDRADRFVRKFNPSRYEEEDGARTNEFAQSSGALTTPHSTTDTPATLYGSWWHSFMQQIAWHERSSWKQTFEEYQAKSPVPTRSAAEWKLFERHLKDDSDFAKRLAQKSGTAHSELPFFWRASEHMSLEGIIDLALIHPNDGSWLILDWKTNRIAADKTDHLRAQYRPQIAAYWKAITAMTGQSVEAGIYATATGQFLLYEETELTREWERLNQLSTEEFAAAAALAFA